MWQRMMAGRSLACPPERSGPTSGSRPGCWRRQVDGRAEFAGNVRTLIGVDNDFGTLEAILFRETKELVRDCAGDAQS